MANRTNKYCKKKCEIDYWNLVKGISSYRYQFHFFDCGQSRDFLRYLYPAVCSLSITAHVWRAKMGVQIGKFNFICRSDWDLRGPWHDFVDSHMGSAKTDCLSTKYSIGILRVRALSLACCSTCRRRRGGAAGNHDFSELGISHSAVLTEEWLKLCRFYN